MPPSPRISRFTEHPRPWNDHEQGARNSNHGGRQKTSVASGAPTHQSIPDRRTGNSEQEQDAGSYEESELPSVHLQDLGDSIPGNTYDQHVGRQTQEEKTETSDEEAERDLGESPGGLEITFGVVHSHLRVLSAGRRLDL